MNNSLWSRFRKGSQPARPNSRTSSPSQRLRANLAVELLENRQLLSANSISGYVFNDLNNNGLFEAGEPPLANATVQLENAQGVVIGNATTDSNGYYMFNTDGSVSTTPTVKQLTANFSSSKTNWTQTQQVAQFDPSLGQLVSVDVINMATLNTEMEFENLDNQAGAITGTIAGQLKLTGPGQTSVVTNVSASKSFNAAAFTGTYNGTPNFSGPTGYDSGSFATNNSQSITLTSASDLANFTGTGQVTLTEQATASSTTSGPGNMLALMNSAASGQVMVVYHYIPNNSLKPGNYTVVLTGAPNGYVDGLRSSNGVVLPNSDGTNSIPVTLANGDSTNNDFGELAPATVSGYVYVDGNNNGVKDAGEPGVAGATVTLTGTNDLGTINPITVQSKSDGSYSFGNLRPGTYTVSETSPPGFLDGQETKGNVTPIPNSNGGPNQISGVSVTQGNTAANNNFGELVPSNLSGYVYYDSNHNNVKDSGDPGLGGATVTLTGTNDMGQAVQLMTSTDGVGAYHFAGLRPGNYTITAAPPSGYSQGTNNVGSLGGTTVNDQFFVSVGVGVAGTNYNFGELQVTSQGGPSGPPSGGGTPPPPNGGTPQPPLTKLGFLSSTFRNWW